MVHRFDAEPGEERWMREQISDAGAPLEDAVLDFVERVPEGRVVTYGLISDALGRSSARGVGRIMALHGQAVPWWRVVRSDGTLPAHLMSEAQVAWREESTPVIRGRVDMARARWEPPAPECRSTLM